MIQGIVRGDQIRRVEFVLDDPEQKRIFNKRTAQSDIELEESGPGWETIYQLIQLLPPGYAFKLTADHNGTVNEGIGMTRLSSEYFIPTRGVGLSILQDTYRSPTWQDAFALGAYQTKWDATRVFQIPGKTGTRPDLTQESGWSRHHCGSGDVGSITGNVTFAVVPDAT